MKKTVLVSITVIIFCMAVYGQAGLLNKPMLIQSDSTYQGLASNGVTQIAAQGDSLIWLGTGRGLSYTRNFGEDILSYFPGDTNLPRGGISALAVRDSVIWVASVFDSTTDVGSQQTGGGLAVSIDNGQNWQHIPQPVDAPGDKYEIWAGDTVNFLPVVTPVSNTTWDIALTEEYVYIVSWAGGLRRSKDRGKTWQRLPLPADEDFRLSCDSIPYQINPRDPPQGNHNHKGFSVLAYGDTLWVGTANGINRGIIRSDRCIYWTKYNASNSAISGDFVVALGRQLWQGQETIWAVTLPTAEAGQYQAISKTRDGGMTWSTTLVGERGYGFAFDDSLAYVCTGKGLYKSYDGENWARYQPVEDIQTGKKIFSHRVYDAMADDREGQSYLWIGTGDGIAKTANDGRNWQIFRQSLATTAADQPAIYAYPNPFYPNHHNQLHGEGHVRIQYHLETAGDVQLEIYNFAMELVFQGQRHSIATAGDHSIVWNGKNTAGDLVANGTYFCKLTRKIENTEKVNWTKLIVVK